MAAELSRLIALYEQHGLSRAAEHLRVVQTGLEAHGLRPPSLNVVSQTVERGEPAAAAFVPPSLAPQQPLRPIMRFDRFGDVRLARESDER